MITSYILITCVPGSETELIKKISGIEEIKEAYMVMGPYDIIAHMEIDDISSLHHLVLTKIRVLEGVRETMTVIAMRI